METAQAIPQTTETAGTAHGPSTREEIDRALEDLTSHKEDWVRMSIPDRIAILDQLREALHQNEELLVSSSVEAKGNDYETMGEAEEQVSNVVIYRQIRFLRKALADIEQYGNPRIPGGVRTRKNGQVVAQVAPVDWKERLALPGIRAEVWMDPTVSQNEDILPQAAFYHDSNRQGGIVAILGAGNVACLIPSDTLYKLFVEGRVVAIKLNPVNDYLGPIMMDIFSSLIQGDYVRILYGGASEGAYLCNHPSVESVHMTGSDRTYEAVVFGPGEEGRQRKQSRNPILTKPFSAELGNISPIIVVPGPWTEKDITYQAKRIGSWLVPNAGCNCLTPRMIIHQKDWEHREAVNKGIRNFLSGLQTRKAYYPGSVEIQREFVAEHPQALQLGEPKAGHLPWTFIPDVDVTNEKDLCFNREPFTGLFSEVGLEAGNVVEFIRNAVEFANNKLWGTLVATILVHPKSMKDPMVADAIEQAVEDLRYGSIVFNNSGVLSYYISNTLWGGYPGSDKYDIQSGTGFVNNPLMFDRPQKSVVYSDFNPIADPYLANLPDNYLYCRQDARYHYNPTIGNLVKLLWLAMTLKES